MARFSVRVAGPPDAAAVSALLEASYLKLFAPRYERHVLAAALPLMTTASPRLLVSGTFYAAQIEAGQLVGCGGWTKEHPNSGAVTPGTGQVRHFATHPDWVRLGIGRAVLARCMEDAKTQGVRILDCFSSLVAVDFYQTLGFVEIRPIEVELTPSISIPGLLMRRELV